MADDDNDDEHYSRTTEGRRGGAHLYIIMPWARARACVVSSRGPHKRDVLTALAFFYRRHPSVMRIDKSAPPNLPAPLTPVHRDTMRSRVPAPQGVSHSTAAEDRAGKGNNENPRKINK